MRLFRFLLLWLIVGALMAPALGDVVSTGSVTSRKSGDSHGWIVRSIDTRGAAVILHLPPRGADAAGHPASLDGSIRRAADLAQTPEAVGAFEERLYMVFPAEQVGNQVTRPVLCFDARRGSIDGSWVGETGENRLPTLPSLPGHGAMIGIVGTPAGPAALLSDSGPDALPVDELHLLIDGAWRRVELPSDIRSRSINADALELGDSGLRLVATPSGLAVVVLDGEATGAWMAEVDAARTAKTGADPVRLAWAFRPLKWRKAQDGQACRPAVSLYFMQDQFIFPRREWGDIALYRATEKGCEWIATAPEVAADFTSVPLDQTGRIAVVSWSKRPGSAISGSQVQMRVVEVSVLTGQTLFDGPADNRPPFSSMELKLLAALLVSMMLVIVLFVMRPESPDRPFALPSGYSLAEPGRRMTAGLVDTAIAISLGSMVTGVKMTEVLSDTVLMRESHALTLLVAVIAVGFVIGTVTEVLLGRSLGKLVTGCEVICVVRKTQPDGKMDLEARRPGIWRAAGRNIVKWLVPPVAMMGMSAPGGRHRGDVAAGTAVVIRLREDERG